MKIQLATIIALLAIAVFAQGAYAQSIPAWIKNNAGWWADGTISEAEFVQAVQFLIKEKILVIPPTSVSEEKSDKIPEWVKNNAQWWADDVISDQEFVGALQHLIKTGIITIKSDTTIQPQAKSTSSDGTLDALQSELDACQEIKKAYQRLDCEKEVKAKITTHTYKTNAKAIVVGPVTFYYPGSDLEISSSGQPLLTVKMLAENSGSSDNITLMCTGPSICNYDVWDGSKAFKYSGMDFTNGQIVLKPGESREFTMLFGPNIGYGGTTFEYDSSKSYYFRVSESWGSANILLDMG